MMISASQRTLDRTLWAAQWILALAFEWIGMVKLGLTADHLRPYYGLGGKATTAMVHTVGAVEVAISLAVILPAITRLLPRVSTLAAAGLGAIALLGTFMPVTAAGAGLPALNLALASLAAFVVWGRLAKAPVAPFADEVPESAAEVRPSARARKPQADGSSWMPAPISSP